MKRSTLPRNDDTFYLPPEAFETADFQRGMKLMMSPDGKSSTIHRFPTRAIH